MRGCLSAVLLSASANQLILTSDVSLTKGLDLFRKPVHLSQRLLKNVTITVPSGVGNLLLPPSGFCRGLLIPGSGLGIFEVLLDGPGVGVGRSSPAVQCLDLLSPRLRCLDLPSVSLQACEALFGQPSPRLSFSRLRFRSIETPPRHITRALCIVNPCIYHKNTAVDTL
jgi:hypothetical protein